MKEIPTAPNEPRRFKITIEQRNHLLRKGVIPVPKNLLNNPEELQRILAGK